MATVTTTGGTQVSTRTQWAQALLQRIGAPVTPGNVAAVVSWETAEGGAGPQFGVPQNVAAYNPLNVTLTSGPQGYGYDPGSGAYFAGASPTPGNQPPVAAFSSWTSGIEATAARLQQPFASTILQALRSAAGVQTLSSAVAKSGWGTGTFANVQGSPGSPSAQTTSAAKTGQDLGQWIGQAAPTGRKGLGAGGTVGATEILVTPSVVPGVSATPPSAPSYGNNPIGDLSTSIKWASEFAGWGFFNLVILGLGLTMFSLGGVLLILVLFGPTTGTAVSLLSKNPAVRAAGALSAGRTRRGAQATRRATRATRAEGRARTQRQRREDDELEARTRFDAPRRRMPARDNRDEPFTDADRTLRRPPERSRLPATRTHRV